MIAIIDRCVRVFGSASIVAAGMMAPSNAVAASIPQDEAEPACLMACPGDDHTSEPDSEPEGCNLSPGVTWGISIVFEKNGSERIDGADCTDCTATASFFVSGGPGTKWWLIGTDIDLEGNRDMSGTLLLAAACGADGVSVPATDLTLRVRAANNCKQWRTVSLTCNSYVD